LVLKNGAEFAVKYLSGVRGVTNSITLKPQVSRIEVKDKIEDAVKRNAEVDARRISVQAADGKVTLKVMCAPGLKRTKLHCSMCRARRNRSSQSNLGCAVNRQTCGYSLVCNSRLSCAHCLRWGSFCETGLARIQRTTIDFDRVGEFTKTLEYPAKSFKHDVDRTRRFGRAFIDTKGFRTMNRIAANGLTLKELEQIEEAAHRSQTPEAKSVLRVAAALREALQIKEAARVLGAQLKKKPDCDNKDEGKL